MPSGDIVDPMEGVIRYLQTDPQLTALVDSEQILGRLPKNYVEETPTITVEARGGIAENYTNLAAPRVHITCYNGTHGKANIMFWMVVERLQGIVSTLVDTEDGDTQRLLSCAMLNGPNDLVEPKTETPCVEGFWQLHAQRRAV